MDIKGVKAEQIQPQDDGTYIITGLPDPPPAQSASTSTPASGSAGSAGSGSSNVAVGEPTWTEFFTDESKAKTEADARTKATGFAHAYRRAVDGPNAGKFQVLQANAIGATDLLYTSPVTHAGPADAAGDRDAKNEEENRNNPELVGRRGGGQ